MADSPQLSQSTSIAKATTTDDRLNAILPSMATEYSPVRVYLPGSANELPSAQQDGRNLPDGTERYVWVAPDVNGDGSDYTVQVECIGAGGGGAGGTNEVGTGAIVLGTWTGAAGTTAAITPTAGSSNGDTLVMIAQTGNAIAQTTNVTDTSGNAWTLAGSAVANGTNPTQLWVYVCYGSTSVSNSGSVTFTTSNSELVNAVFIRLPAAIGPSTAATQGTSQTAASTTFPMGGTWNTNDGVLVVAANNTGINWHSTLDLPSGTDSNGVSVAPYWMNLVNNQLTGTEKLSVFFGNPTQASNSTGVNIQASGGGSMNSCAGVVLPFQYACVPVPGSPGGGGGGGEYAAENAYPVTPGKAYAYQIGNQGNGGLGQQSGSAGGDTIFDLHGFGIEGGVVAHGGTGGVQGGNPGTGGTGSTNSIHFDGGAGGASSAGVGSDDPTMYSSAVFNDQYFVHLTFDESVNNNVAYDISSNNRTTTRHLQSGGVIRSTSPSDTFFSPRSPQAPAQVPASRHSGTTPGNIKRWVLNGNGQNGGYEITGVPKHWTSAFTFSAWIQGGSGASDQNDWGGGNAVIFGCNNFSSNNGFSVYMNNGMVWAFVGDGASNSMTVASSAQLNAQDGKWHLVQVDYSGSSTLSTIRFWIDGVLDSTWVISGSTAVSRTLINGDFNLTVGYNLGTGWNCFEGNMSNAWFTAVNFLNTTIVGQIIGTVSSTGGGGGGASGGSAGSGNAGSPSAGTTGGAGGLPNTAVLAPGTLDSNSGSSGGSGGTGGLSTGGFGGGGGGASKSSVGNGGGTSFNLSAPANRSATYTGMDATSSGGSLYSDSDDAWSAGDSTPAQTISTALCITGGKPELPANGTMSSILQFPIIGNLATWDGTTLGAGGGGGNRWIIDRMYLTLTVNSPNAAMIGVSSVRDEVMPSELTDTELAQWIADGTIGGPALYFIPKGDAGRQVTLTLNPSVFISSGPALLASDNPFMAVISTFRGSLASSAVKDMGIGGYSDPENQEFYCEFYGAGTEDGLQDAILSFDYHLSNNFSSGLFITAGGNGNAGQIRVTYLTSEGNPVTTILPAAITDANQNQLAAGITTSKIRTWKPGTNLPGVPAVLEDWTNVTPPGPGTGVPSAWTGTLRYKAMENNCVRIECNINVPSGGTATTANPFVLFTLPVNYRPISEKGFSVGTFVTTASNSQVIRGYAETDGTVRLNGLGSSTAINQVQFIQDIPLD